MPLFRHPHAGENIDRPRFIDVVQPSALSALRIEPGNSGLAPGTSLQLKAVGVFSNNTEKTLSQGVAWISSDAAAASVDENGLVVFKGAGSGSVTITAISGSISGSAVITLADPVSLIVSPSP